ncbi:MAG: hypothetical protein HQK54_10750, partial [Oligoflexales bacterium]|nr:hypothetical protein [Oligoflexales bacterium]
KECIQRLGFLWGESIPDKPPELSPTPLFHQEFYLCPENRIHLRNWVDGKHFRKDQSHRALHETEVKYVELNRVKEITDNFYVAKAISKNTIPLVFGDWLSEKIEKEYGHLVVHPIA